MSKDTSGPAFPQPNQIHPGNPNPGDGEGMSLRQYAAIKLKVADSGVDWLDEMITKSKLDDLAEKAMNGILSRSTGCYLPDKEVAMQSYMLAAAMPKARETK